MAPTQREQELENRMINLLVQLGYERVTINDESELLDNLREQIYLHNKARLNNTPLSDKEFEKFLNSLRGMGVFKSAYNLRQLQTIERDDGSIAYIQLVNQQDWCKNRFQVTNQITVEARRVNRYDVTLLINGLPLVQIELKRRGVEMKQAFNQINRYKSESYTDLFKYIQLFVISNGVNTRYVANDEMKLNYNFAFAWADIENKMINNLSDVTRDFLNPCQIAKVISRYMVLNQTSKKLMVMRPYQIYAVEKLVERATETRNNGYVWHATGSGKTLTSFKLSQILANFEDIEKVIFLVDRKDLDAQTLSEFNKFEPGSVDMTDSTNNLIKQLTDSNKRLIITTIQKMNNAIKNDRYAEVMEPYKTKRVIFIVDECHRSQFGDMHKLMKKHFDNAQYFGFTGTPIFEENTKDGLATGNLFGKQVHHYMIKDGIRDNNVLGFKVDYLSTFDMKEFVVDNDVEDIDKKEVMESEQRVNLIVNKIISIHNIKTHNQEFNALFAVSNINMAIKYYNAFKDKYHSFNVATIFTYGANSDSVSNQELHRDSLEKAIDDYNEIFNTNFSTDSYSNYFNDVSKRFKNKEIDILIVVNMFLTGFDSKLLNTLYVDKKLKMHNLIQAFSRTNRVYNMKKQFGNIVSFMTKRQDVQEAVYVYSNSESTDIVILDPYEEYVRRIKEQILHLKSISPTVQYVDRLESETSKKEFIQAFRQVARTVVTLNNFLEFEFTKDEITMSEQEFEDYKSKYLDLSRTVSKKDKISILDDVSFDIELLSRDKINVDYILKLLADINLQNRFELKRELTRIGKILDHNDTPEMHSKIELLRKFIQRVIPTLDHNAVIEEEYENFIEREKEEEIYKMSENLSIEKLIIKEMVSDYQFTGVIPNDRIRKTVDGPLPVKHKRMNTLREFLVDFTDKY